VADPWHVVEILNAIFGLLTLLFFVLRSVAVVKAVEFMMNNRSKIFDIIWFLLKVFFR